MYISKQLLDFKYFESERMLKRADPAIALVF